jgi:hypothetical protein
MDRPTGPTVRRVLRTSGGPALIVGAVLLVLAPLLTGRLFPAQIDLLGYWLPTYRFLARTLTSGHVPAWNPHALAGVAFAADPQSGWLSPTAVALFAALPPLPALRWFLALQPILAGLGVYAFLRTEGTSSAAATAGGLVLALGIAGSRYVALPWMSASLAWAALTLAAAARWRRADRWPRRLLWTLLVALAWGQILVAHPSNGLVVGTLALLLYLAVAIAGDLRAGRRTAPGTVGAVAILVVALPAVNLFAILPRAAGLAGTTEALGYARMAAISRGFSGSAFDGLVFPHGFLPPTWPLGFARSPGLYLGMAALVLAFAGWFVRPRRGLVAAFSALGAACYLLTLGPVARVVEDLSGRSRGASLYLHAPNQFDFGVMLAVAVLAGLGLQAWSESSSWRTRAAMLAPGAAVWVVLAWRWEPATRPLLVALGLAGAAIALWWSAGRPARAGAVAAVVAAELAVAGIAGQWFVPAPGGAPDPYGTAVMRGGDVSAFERPGPIALALRTREGRFVSFDPDRWGPWGYVARQLPGDAGLLGSQQSMVFGLEDAQGYNPWQQSALWALFRAAQPGTELRYASSYWRELPAVVRDLLRIDWAVAPADRPPVPGVAPAAVQGRWALFPAGPAHPGASVVPSWRVLPSNGDPPAAALAAAVAPGFDPEREAIVERDPGLPVPESASSLAGTASYAATGPASARVDVVSQGSAIVLVRTAFAPGWHATVDGRPADVLRVDGVIQGVPVAGGRHTIELTYVDPWIGYGLAGSAPAIAGLALGAILSRRPRRTRRSRPR